MLSTTVASPCHTLREKLAGDHDNPSIIGTAYVQFTEGLHFSAFHFYIFVTRIATGTAALHNIPI